MTTRIARHATLELHDAAAGIGSPKMSVVATTRCTTLSCAARVLHAPEAWQQWRVAMQDRFWFRFVIALGVLITGSALFAQTDNGDWTTYNRTYSGHRFSPLGEINTTNVQSLKKVCSVDIPEGKSFQTGVIAVNGTIYATTDMATYAIDGNTCAIKWTNPHRYSPASMLGANRGVAYANGRLFRGAGDGHVFAIDAASGKTLWDVAIGDPANGESVPMAPIAWNDVVYVGNAGGDNYGVIGRVHALSAGDGHELWQFRTIPNTPEVMATWGEPGSPNEPTGGAFWTTFALDPAKGILYVPAGNPAPDFMKQIRPGKNLYANSIIAIDARTGRMLGYNQTVKDDFHDWDVSAAPALITTRGNQTLALTAGKDGYLYGLAVAAIDMNGGEDAQQGGILYKTSTTTHFNTTEPLSETRATRFCPGSQGGSEWNGAAYDPSLNLAIVPAVDWCTSAQLAAFEQMKAEPGHPWSGERDGGFGKQDPKSRWKGWITAADADSGKQAWQVKMPTPILAAVTPTAGGVTFAADLNGKVYALNSRSGKKLWTGNAGQPVGGGIIAYQANEHERIAVAAGMKSPIWPVATTTARVVIFGLK
jgi:alcohol dehydrogenase (cytochrome c)